MFPFTRLCPSTKVSGQQPEYPAFIPIFPNGPHSQQISAWGRHTGGQGEEGGIRQELALSVHPGPSQAPPRRLWGGQGLHLARVPSSGASRSRATVGDAQLGLMPVACKKPGSRLQRKRGSLVELHDGNRVSPVYLRKPLTFYDLKCKLSLLWAENSQTRI
jgi:hypothetical protein